VNLGESEGSEIEARQSSSRRERDGFGYRPLLFLTVTWLGMISIARDVLRNEPKLLASEQGRRAEGDSVCPVSRVTSADFGGLAGAPPAILYIPVIYEP
jgi:hypothetical protein